jgi:hypothetical protein
MSNLYAVLRKVIADLRSKEALGAVVVDAIQSVIIPKVERMITQEHDVNRQSVLQELLEQYKQYGDDRNPLSKTWGNIGNNAVEYQAQAIWRAQPMEQEDAVSELIGNFYSNPAWVRSFDAFDPLKGPAGLAGYWKMMIGRKSQDFFRDLKKEQSSIQQVEEDEEGNADPFARIPAPHSQPEIDTLNMAEQLEGLDDYVRSHAISEGGKDRAPVMIELFDMWWDLTSREKDVGRRQIYQKYKERHPDSPISLSGLDDNMKRVDRLIARFFTEELHYKLPEWLRKKLRMGSVDVIAAETIRQRMARWVLGL